VGTGFRIKNALNSIDYEQNPTLFDRILFEGEGLNGRSAAYLPRVAEFMIDSTSGSDAAK
jgi:hypothetical protein